MEGWRARLEGSEMFGSRGSILCVGSAIRGFCGSQGWTEDLNPKNPGP